MATDTQLLSPADVAEVLDAGISVHDLQITMGDRQVLHNINVAFPRNKITAIIGPTGCGKTTLLRALNRMHDNNPSIVVRGKVCLGDVDVYRTPNVREVRRRIGMVFQRPNPFPQSILENIVIGPRSHGLGGRSELRLLAEEKLRAVGLWEAVSSRLDSSPFHLSGGQQQLLCLARALSVQPSVLLLDEPTSSLDPNTTLCVEALTRRLKDEMTIVMVTHNLQQAKRLADQVLFLTAGYKIEYAAADRFFRAPEDPRSRAYIAEVLG